MPYEEAIKGTELNFNPGVSDGATIYADMIALLDEAKTDLAATPAVGGASCVISTTAEISTKVDDTC